MTTILLIGGSLLSSFGLGGTLFGFGTAGVAAGSAAAAVQAGIGNVVAGSLFATMTSLGMQGVFVGSTIWGGITTVVGAAATFLK